MSLRFFILFCVLTGLFASGLGKVEGMEAVYLRGKLLTSKKEVLLSEIAKLPDGMKDRVVLKNLNAPTVIRPENLKDVLAGIPVSGKETLILPLDSELDPEDLEESLKKEVSKLPQDKEGDFKISYLSGERTVPSQGVELKWAGLPQVIHPGQIVASLDFYFENRKVHAQRIKFKLERRTNALFAKQEIRKGQKLQAEDLEERTVYMEETFTDGISSKDIGSTALKDLQIGELLRKKQFRFLFDVQRGGDVNLVYTKGNLVVKSKTKALSSGNIGEIVDVFSHSKEGKISARVVEKGIVLLEN
ncbi:MULTISPECIES: flagellar basal body P-ring formation chaperone FlgA [unclassified Leptospira]|uniref:flagellar basal body P-ring formation chaperone FlgA n=1 Tax=unclassified Leptospira TaxID=2633828 RepID=UPI0002BFB0AA|nr:MULTISPECIES: flagellar basal body P-ring formation chaperone FlgA [unclassified Leptospira]EMK02304.1 flagella basal body P-ring formation protein FlgA [Leptospira sp. B5-022]MCR1793640.1 flagellar basal body P-ring formation chaperone FlgA [Leptospira sp. id769339]